MKGEPAFPALASIHDLMPDTLGRVERIIDILQDKKVFPAALLVVPGKPWADSQLEKIHQWVAGGYTLIAHGWHHWGPPRSFGHHIHSLLISRQEAEHLSKSREEVLDLMQRSHDWFEQQGFPAPEVYIPPTWALGSIAPSDLVKLPYRCVETTFGVWTIPGKQSGDPEFTPLPVTGFLADTIGRAWFSKPWNELQARKARARGCPLRLSIHPDDFQLRLADQLHAFLDEDWHWIDYREIWSSPALVKTKDSYYS